MKTYPEWQELHQTIDSHNPFSVLYDDQEGNKFYIEPVFYTQLSGFKERHPDRLPLILEEMQRLVKKYRRVVFTGNFDNPLTEVEGFVFLEIFDVTNKLQIFVEDKSRGSDYGD